MQELMIEQNENVINHLNNSFYDAVADSFSNTRQFYWDGWSMLWNLQKADLPAELKALDIGCGNGRLAKFLNEKNSNVDYTGIDSNKRLLQIATHDNHLSKAKFLHLDIIHHPGFSKYFARQSFDLICIFGLAHHLQPDNLIRLLIETKKLLSVSGQIWISFWQFNHNKSLIQRAINSENQIQQKLHSTKVKIFKYDYLLDWQRSPDSLRFAHLYKNEEISKVLDKSGLNARYTLYADGKSHEENLYIVCTI